MTQTIQMASLLTTLQQNMAQIQQWQDSPPSAKALASREPFFVDTLEPQQWLQWVFIPKMQALISSEQALPRGFSLSPYFEETWKLNPEFNDVLAVIHMIDKACE